MFAQLLPDYVGNVMRYIEYALPGLLAGCLGLTFAYVTIYAVESTLRGFFNDFSMSPIGSLVVVFVTLFLWLWVSLAVYISVHVIRNVPL